MADLPSTEQLGSATTWFTSKAGITATVLAVVAIAEAAALVCLIRRHDKHVAAAHAAAHTHWAEKFEAAEKLWRGKFEDAETAWKLKVTEWAARIDQFRTDVKEAFNQNDNIADKVVDVLTKLQIEIARMSARRD
jgi:hypothetical protein